MPYAEKELASAVNHRQLLDAAKERESGCAYFRVAAGQELRRCQSSHLLVGTRKTLERRITSKLKSSFAAQINKHFFYTQWSPFILLSLFLSLFYRCLPIIYATPCHLLSIHILGMRYPFHILLSKAFVSLFYFSIKNEEKYIRFLKSVILLRFLKTLNQKFMFTKADQCGRLKTNTFLSLYEQKGSF